MGRRGGGKRRGDERDRDQWRLLHGVPFSRLLNPESFQRCHRHRTKPSCVVRDSAPGGAADVQMELARHSAARDRRDNERTRQTPSSSHLISGTEGEDAGNGCCVRQARRRAKLIHADQRHKPLSTPNANANPSSTLPLEASSRSPQPFSLNLSSLNPSHSTYVAGTLMPASQFSQTEDAIRPSEAGQSSEAETTTGKGRAKKHAADFA
jgi:hypothetical protein